MFRLAYYIVLCIFWSLLTVPSLAQANPDGNETVQRLEAELRTARQDTAKAEILNQLSDYWSETDSAKAIGYARQSVRLSSGFPFHLARSHFYVAGAYFYFNADIAKIEYQKAIALLASDTSRRALSLSARSWHNYASLLQRDGDDKAFINILLEKVVPLADRAKDTLRLASVYGGLAMVFSNIFNYDKAVSYYHEAIDLARGLPDAPEHLPALYTRLAQNYLYSKKIKEAGRYLDSTALLLGHSSLSFDQVNYNMVRGTYFSDINDWASALKYMDTAIAQAERLELYHTKKEALFQKFKIYKNQEKFATAKAVLLSLYNDTLMSDRPEDKMTILYHLAQMDAGLHRDKEAFQWLSMYAALSDSLNEEKLTSDIASLEMKYQSEKKQREILDLQSRQKSQQIALQRNKSLTYALLAGLFFLLSVSAVIYMLYRDRRHKALKEKQDHIRQLEVLEQAHRIKSYNAMLEGQEQERKRIAQDLHDGLGGLLAGVKLKLSDFVGQQKPNDMKTVIGQLDYSIQELRRIARNLMPQALIRFGVEMALKDLCDSFETPSLNVDFQSFGLKKDIPHRVQVTLYRIVQELLANAIRHGKAKNILVQCSQNEDRIYVTVEDDGKGFDPKEKSGRNKGIGLTNLISRIDYLKGKLDIQSVLDEGTTVNVEINAYEKEINQSDFSG